MRYYNIKGEFKALQKEYPCLELKYGDDFYVIEGFIGFSTVISDKKIEDEYKIKLHIPKNYPKNMISAYEAGGRISPAPDNHRNSDGTLCTGLPVEVARILAPNYRLIDYVEKILIGYLAQYSYFEKFKHWPFGEAAHGTEGIVEYYKERYNLPDTKSVLDFLKMLQSCIQNRQKGYKRCRCGCGKLYKNCKRQRKILKYGQKSYDYLSDIKAIEDWLKSAATPSYPSC